MKTNLVNLGDGVEGLYVEDSRFKTTLVSFSFFLPLKEDTAADNALIPFLLTTSCEECPSFKELNIRLAKLYGAKISASVSKVGDCQLLKMSVACLNDRFALNGEKIVSEATGLLAAMIFNPQLCGEAFLTDEVEREKRLMKERILGEINEKRLYARNQLLSLMFRDDDYKTERYGSMEALDKTTPESLFLAWERMLRSAFVRVQIFGETYPETIFDAVKSAFQAIKRENITDVSKVRPYVPSGYIEEEENLDVTQGKLVLGFSSNFRGDSKSVIPMTVMVDIFGGGPYSKLFNNVREKLSLCYYCAASYGRQKGYMMVDSGVEASNADKAMSAILEELNNIKLGNITNEELEYSKVSIKDSLKSSLDSQGALDTWFCLRVPDGDIMTPDELIEIVDSVTAEDVIYAANGTELTTVYRLMPKKEADQ